MRLLIDEMFAPEVAAELRDAGHEASHVSEVGLIGASDTDVLTFAAADERVVVTENAADFVPLLDQRIAAGVGVPPVVIASKRHLPRGSRAMSHRLAVKLDAWARQRPDPYRYVHWLA